MKFLELDNLNFNIPGLIIFIIWFHYFECIKLHNIICRNPGWKTDITNFFWFYYILVSNDDFYYLPNYIIPKFSEIIKVFYKTKFYVECTVPNELGIISPEEYQLIHYRGLWERERNNVAEYLHKKYILWTIHPIKFSNIKYRNLVKLYKYLTELVFLNLFDRKSIIINIIY